MPRSIYFGTETDGIEHARQIVYRRCPVLFDAHLAPIGWLFAHIIATAVHAGSHLAVRDDDGNRVVGRDLDPVVSCGMASRLSGVTRSRFGANAIPAVPRARPPPTRPPVATTARRVHLMAHLSFGVARWNGRATHALVGSAAADVGDFGGDLASLGGFAQRAAAAMIIPDWQYPHCGHCV
jgi:hypothetical protein